MERVWEKKPLPKEVKDKLDLYYSLITDSKHNQKTKFDVPTDIIPESLVNLLFLSPNFVRQKKLYLKTLSFMYQNFHYLMILDASQRHA